MSPKNKALILALVALAVGIWLLNRHMFSKTLIFLEQGGAIEAENVYIEKEQLRYTTDNRLASLDLEQVQHVVAAAPDNWGDAKRRMIFYGARFISVLSGKGAPKPSSGSQAGARAMEFSGSSPVNVVAGLLIALLLAAALVLRIKARPQDAEKEPSQPAAVDGPSHPAVPRMTGIKEIENYFLQMYRRQISSDPNATAQIEPLPEKSAGGGQVYQLRVWIEGDWKTRRMTIGKLGEGTGSKSQCFYVIYDSHLVIKIPPVPIADFDDYLDRIRKETRITLRLAPRESIIPNVSVILSKIHRLPELQHQAGARQVEAAYRELLEKSPGLREYLQIGGAYVFFMDLSRYYFLGQVMKGLHDSTPLLQTAIGEDSHLSADCHGFEDRYGGSNGWVCFELQRLYDQFENRLDKLCRQMGTDTVVGFDARREAFFAQLADLHQDKILVGLSPRVRKPVLRLLTDVLASENDLVTTYRVLIGNRTRRQLLERNRPRAATIIANLLDLLAWLGEKQVAIRDLKADNLLVAGDTKNYPGFLTSVNEYSIGLIDVETAVHYAPMSASGPSQPQLGGTPYYATPSHFFVNELLSDNYPELGEIFHLQDWHAMVGMIFEVATARRLFTATSRLLPQMLRSLNMAITMDGSPQTVFADFNHRFWKQAVQEFKAALARDAHALEHISVYVPERIRARIADWVRQETHGVSETVADCIECCPVVRSPKQSDELMRCKPDVVRRAREKYGRVDTDSARKFTDLLDELEPLKRQQARLNRYREVLNTASEPVRLDILLELMFAVVEESMSRTDLPAEPPQASEPADEVDEVDEVDAEATTADCLGYTMTAEA